MPKYEITETCNEIRVYTYTVEAESEGAAKEMFRRGECLGPWDEYAKDCLYSEIDVEEMEP